jgi:hypothetical protein
MPRKAEQRLTIPSIGEWYADLLAIDAAINARTPGQQAQSLLCAKLQEREGKIRERVAYFAAKRGLTPDEMWRALATGKYVPITPEEWAETDEAVHGDFA